LWSAWGGEWALSTKNEKPGGRIELEFEIILKMQVDVYSVGYWKLEV
jgi:hypothetical protein